MARLKYVVAAAIVAAANAVSGGEIDSEAALKAVAGSFIAIVDRLVIQRWATLEYGKSKSLRETLSTVLSFLRRQEPHA